MASVRDHVLDARENLRLERAGLASPRQNAAAIAELRRPAPPAVVNAPEIRSPILGGGAMADLLRALDDQGIVNDQSSAGTDPITGAGDDAVLPQSDTFTLPDGALLGWSDEARAWIPVSIGDVSVRDHASQATADNGSTTNTSTPVVAITKAIALPPGVWSFRVTFDGRATHGVGGNVSLQINVGGVASGSTWTGGSTSASRTMAAQSASPGSFVGTSTGLANIAGGGTVNVFGGYFSSAGNTATMNCPRLVIDAWRTA